MNDEANTNYYAMIDQLIDGHEWLRNNIDPSIRPVNGWAIDPFGYSPTMAYILKEMGFQNMVIQRVHYIIKKYFAKTNMLEFDWIQSWSTKNGRNTSIFTHVMPFSSYAVKKNLAIIYMKQFSNNIFIHSKISESCGPDRSVCCQFDFNSMSW